MNGLASIFGVAIKNSIRIENCILQGLFVMDLPPLRFLAGCALAPFNKLFVIFRYKHLGHWRMIHLYRKEHWELGCVTVYLLWKPMGETFCRQTDPQMGWIERENPILCSACQ